MRPCRLSAPVTAVSSTATLQRQSHDKHATTLSTTERDFGATSGSYTINVSGAVDANYSISYVTGSMNVTQVALTITADNKSKIYGAAVPTLTASYSGLVNGDTSASLTTARPHALDHGHGRLRATSAITPTAFRAPWMPTIASATSQAA